MFLTLILLGLIAFGIKFKFTRTSPPPIPQWTPANSGPLRVSPTHQALAHRPTGLCPCFVLCEGWGGTLIFPNAHSLNRFSLLFVLQISVSISPLHRVQLWPPHLSEVLPEIPHQIPRPVSFPALTTVPLCGSVRLLAFFTVCSLSS